MTFTPRPTTGQRFDWRGSAALAVAG